MYPDPDISNVYQFTCPHSMLNFNGISSWIREPDPVPVGDFHAVPAAGSPAQPSAFVIGQTAFNGIPDGCTCGGIGPDKEPQVGIAVTAIVPYLQVNIVGPYGILNRNFEPKELILRPDPFLHREIINVQVFRAATGNIKAQ